MYKVDIILNNFAFIAYLLLSLAIAFLILSSVASFLIRIEILASCILRRRSRYFICPLKVIRLFRKVLKLLIVFIN